AGIRDDLVTGVQTCALPISAIKQPELFLAAAARLAHDNPRAHFLIAGGGELERAARDTVSALGLGDHVHLLGWQRDIATVYAARSEERRGGKGGSARGGP